MADAVCRMLTLLCTLVVACPIGTNLGLLHLLWMLASGRLLGARGALFPGLADYGLSASATWRAWTALGQGDWTSGPLIGRWAGVVAGEGQWQPHVHGGYRGTAVISQSAWPAAPRAWWLSTRRGRWYRVLAPTALRLPNHPLPRRGRQGAPGHPARPHRRGWQRRSAAACNAACLRPDGPADPTPSAQRPRAALGTRGGAAVCRR